MAESDQKPPILSNPIQISKTDDEDTLVDVHVNNPLKKITKLLEEIKKQKAFSFTIKGSLGIAGIALVVTTFGIFGGTKAFCSRGTQTALGRVKILEVTELPGEPLPLLDQIKDMLWKSPDKQLPRVVLLKFDEKILHLRQVTQEEAKKFNEKSVLVTGEYDACNEQLTVTSPNAIQTYP